MEKKAVVITQKGYAIKVADHMLGDLAKFGATTQRPVLKPTPKEILNMPKKVVTVGNTVTIESNLPKMEVTEVKAEVIPEVPVLTKVEPKVRKTPVRSKSKA